jgi:hypothetical protein
MTTTFRSLMSTRFPTGELEPGRWYVDGASVFRLKLADRPEATTKRYSEIARKDASGWPNPPVENQVYFHVQTSSEYLSKKTALHVFACLAAGNTPRLAEFILEQALHGLKADSNPTLRFTAPPEDMTEEQKAAFHRAQADMYAQWAEYLNRIDQSHRNLAAHVLGLE